jgi:hypothetical protein
LILKCKKPVPGKTRLLTFWGWVQLAIFESIFVEKALKLPIVDMILL